MKAIILVAGEGMRMRPLTLTTPKPLLKVGDKTLLEHLVSTLPPKISELIMVIGYLGEKIQDFCGDEFLGRPVSYVWQKDPMGTYHALKMCQPMLKPNERFGVFFSDDLMDKKTVEDCLSHELSLVGMEHPEPQRFGVITLNPDGSIKNIVEKPQNPESNFVAATGYVLNTKIFDYEPPQNPNGEYYLAAAIDRMAKEHKIMAVPANFWFPIATPEDLAKAEKLLHNLS